MKILYIDSKRNFLL